MRGRLLAVLSAILIAVLAGCGGESAAPGSLAVGARESDPQSVLLANLYAAALQSYGTPAHVEQMPDPLIGLDSGKVSVVPGFTGRLLQTFAPGTAGRSDEQVYKAMVGVLPEGVAAGDYATAAEDKAAAAVTERTAASWGRDLTGLPKQCALLRTGVLAGQPSPQRIGSCTLPQPHEFTDSAQLFDALRANRINLAWTSTANPDVPAEVVVLVEGKPPLIQAQNVVPLYRRNELTARQVLAVNEVAGVLDTAALKQLRRQVAQGADPRTVAEDWLAENPIGR